MRPAAVVRFVLLAVVLSAAAPAVLAASGVDDRNLLLVVFLPSLFVALTTAWFALRLGAAREPWVFVRRRRR